MPGQTTLPEVVIRADASRQIGTGHVMRCLALAEFLRDAKYDVSFAIRALPGHLGARIENAGFNMHVLPAASDHHYRPGPDEPAYASWAGVPWQEDARATKTILQTCQPEWLVVDHYAFDARWERAVAGEVGHILVWDDLADRPHFCDILLDQNLGRTAQTYAGLVPSGARVLAGPRYAVLRREFSEIRGSGQIGKGDHGLRRIMVSMGGVDAQNATSAVLDVLAGMEHPENLNVEVVIGSQSPALENVRSKAASMPMAVAVTVDADDMAFRISRADIAIGAAGVSAWERCALGLPSLLIVIAENQRQAAEQLAASGAAVLLGEQTDPLWPDRLANWLKNPARDSRLPRMAAAAAAVCDAMGGRRVVAEIQQASGG